MLRLRVPDRQLVGVARIAHGEPDGGLHLALGHVDALLEPPVERVDRLPGSCPRARGPDDLQAIATISELDIKQPLDLDKMLVVMAE